MAVKPVSVSIHKAFSADSHVLLTDTGQLGVDGVIVRPRVVRGPRPDIGRALTQPQQLAARIVLAVHRHRLLAQLPFPALLTDTGHHGVTGVIVRSLAVRGRRNVIDHVRTLPPLPVVKVAMA